MRTDFIVGKALGIKDPTTGQPAVALIYDGDSVMATFHGTDAKFNAELVAVILNKVPKKYRDALLGRSF